MKIKKFLSLITAAAISAVNLAVAAPCVSAIEGGEVLIKAECEDLSGAELWTSIYENQLPGYSGEGFAYVTSKAITLEVEAPEEGMYQIDVRYAQILDKSGRDQTISVNGKKNMIKFPYTDKWTDISMGVFRLNKGTNEIEISPQYGYAAYDTITITKAMPNDYSKATSTLTDSNATSETKALMKYLKSVYGNHILSGQQEIYGGGMNGDGNMEKEFDWLLENTGKLPAIRGFDMMNYNPLYGWEDGTTERLIDWVTKKGGIATVCWHINVPIDFKNYTLGDEVDWKDCTYKNYQSSNGTFDTSKAVVEGTKEYEYFMAAVDDLAEQLLLCQEAGVPIIFRPLHEAQGNEGNYGDGTAWFWWGDRGAEVYKELWKLLYTTLTEKYELHNLIWEFNSYNYANSPTWYPGDDYVDIVAYDKYNVENNRDDGLSSGPNVSAISRIFNYLYNLVDGGKMLAISECDTVPTVENMTVEDAGWLYFCPWYGDYLMSERYQDPETLSEIYNSDYCITLDELPENLYSNSSAEETTVKPAEIVYGDTNCDGLVDISDAVLLKCYLINNKKYAISAQGALNADVHGNNNGLNAQDAVSIQKFVLGAVKTLPIK
ncbi:MAG TPA: glycosyl hydrolase [Ruminococcus sp.]|nr:glycosyl hydrolase [Ruminococcus sp.]MDY3844149.1 glycosyl hydrolase [Ruminococcus sp.]